MSCDTDSTVIIEGCATFPVALLTMFIVPDYPQTTRWLTDEERTIATLRIVEDSHEDDEHAKVPGREALTMAFTDPALYLIWFMYLGLNTAASFTNFFPTIVQTLGYSERITLLLSAPPYVVAALLGVLNSWHSDRTRERWLHIAWPQVLCSVGFLVAAATMNRAARYTATFCMMCVYVSFGCLLSWVATTLPRPAAKRAVAYAAVNALANLAAIYASYFYPARQGPRYWQANVINVGFAAACILFATALRCHLRARNRMLDRAAAEDERDAGRGDGGAGPGPRVRALALRWQCHPDYRYTL